MKKALALLLTLSLVLPGVAQAARLDTIGMEANSTAVVATGGIEFTLNGEFGAPDGPSTTHAHGDTHSLYFGQTTTAAFSWDAYEFRSTASAATTTVRAYVYLNSVFSQAIELISLANNTPGQLASLRLNASNQLCLFNVTPAQVGSCVSISTGAWHDIEISTNGSSNVFGQLDGTVFASGFGGTQTGATSRVYFGNAFAAAGKSDMYFDDMAINDGTGTTETWWPGPGTDIRLSPNAAGDINTFATQTGGTAGAANNFTRVFETTPDGATTFNGSNTLNQSDMFNVTDPTAIGASDTITLVEDHVWFRGSVASATATYRTQIEKAAAGTITQGPTVAPNATTFKPNTNALPNLPPITLYNDPDGSAWTKTTITSMQIGYKVTTASTNRDDISQTFVYVEYIPSVTPPSTSPNFGFLSFFGWW